MVERPLKMRMNERPYKWPSKEGHSKLRSRFLLTRTGEFSLLRILAHAEFELPALGIKRADAPELEHAKLGDFGLEVDGDVVFVDLFGLGEIRFERIGF